MEPDKNVELSKAKHIWQHNQQSTYRGSNNWRIGRRRTRHTWRSAIDELCAHYHFWIGEPRVIAEVNSRYPCHVEGGSLRTASQMPFSYRATVCQCPSIIAIRMPYQEIWSRNCMLMVFMVLRKCVSILRGIWTVSDIPRNVIGELHVKWTSGIAEMWVNSQVYLQQACHIEE